MGVVGGVTKRDGPKLSPSSEKRIQEGKKEMCKVPPLFPKKKKSDCGYKVN